MTAFPLPLFMKKGILPQSPQEQKKWIYAIFALCGD
jgi:hypothetical protein